MENREITIFERWYDYDEGGMMLRMLVGTNSELLMELEYRFGGKVRIPLITKGLHAIRLASNQPDDPAKDLLHILAGVLGWLDDNPSRSLKDFALIQKLKNEAKQ